jgi:signal transduction histidine kinase
MTVFPTSQLPLYRRTLPLFVVAFLLSMLSTLIISWLLLKLPGDELQRLVVVMSGTGILTTLLSYVFYRAGLWNWFGSVRWTLLLVTLFTVALILLNVWVLAKLMFVETQYVTLTGTLLVYVGLTTMSYSYFISRAMTDRLQALAAAANQLAEGDLTTRLPQRGNDEIAQLTHAFNMMAHNLQRMDEEKRRLELARRNLIAWVSHDLRTPLASMRVMLEAVTDGVVADDATIQRYVKNSLDEIHNLSDLINELFEMAQLDAGHLPLNIQPTSLRDMISDTLGSMSAKAARKQITLSGLVEDGVDIVPMAPEKIQRVLSNLVNNAILYTPEHERVMLHARRLGDMVEVVVHNTGVYIPPEELPRLFESFYRGEKSRARAEDGARGAGLGLAIARGFVEAHGGTIRAESDPQQGTRFIFTLLNKPHNMLS